ncbi:Kiwa anti-phage protein KwaB-like domain-containing protein [Empedobacter falsenii]|uniref:Kiwa anti-phage protein KwaB-like domain-containing protein n=1 Tax=Empedobacter TaxID=59734 RepID=UPI002575F788|nr:MULTISPECIES: Kiwa anti-phage protein KwaB-like domain-containing protein [Empedobacter]MDM1041314.1 DUF4868 domain-containing protein [Empedobacter brevis]MDM1134622.1 DUF4868 domain-containing protein [Empedobacter sp. R750]
MILNDILQKIEENGKGNIILYFITRILKPNVKASTKMLDKYDFKVYQIDINEEIREHLYNLSVEQIGTILKYKTELHEYDVITDDSQQLFTYQMTNKAMSFADVINNQLVNNPPKIKSLEEIIMNEELWAYCVGFFNENEEWIYTFRKILSAKVAVDEKSGNKKNALQKSIRTLFNSKSQKLELIEGETVNLDKQIDCIFYEDTFYVAKKTQFEQIIGLEEEYRIQANQVITQLEQTNMFIGTELLQNSSDKNPSLHKKLVRLSKIGNYQTLDKKTVTKMQGICKKYGEKLNLKDGKIHIEDENDITLTLKVLADYYKVGEVSGKPYGTFAGKALTTTE